MTSLSWWNIALPHILLFWTCRAGCPAHVWCQNPRLVKRLVGEGVSVSRCVVCGWTKGFLVDSLARGNSMTGYWNWNISLDCQTPGRICATCVIGNTVTLVFVLFISCVFSGKSPGRHVAVGVCVTCTWDMLSVTCPAWPAAWSWHRNHYFLVVLDPWY